MEFALQLSDGMILKDGDSFLIDDPHNVHMNMKIDRISPVLETVFVEILDGIHAGSTANIPLNLFGDSAKIIELPDDPNDPNFAFLNRGNS